MKVRFSLSAVLLIVAGVAAILSVAVPPLRHVVRECYFSWKYRNRIVKPGPVDMTSFEHAQQPADYQPGGLKLKEAVHNSDMDAEALRGLTRGRTTNRAP